jgi:hypothetical protein
LIDRIFADLDALDELIATDPVVRRAAAEVGGGKGLGNGLFYNDLEDFERELFTVESLWLK